LQLWAGLNLLDNLSTVVAFHAFAQERQDVAAPTVLIGGQAALWLAALAVERPAEGPPAGEMTVMYSGPELATQVAVAGTLAPPATGNAIPAGYAPLLAPRAQAGAPLWASLPLLLAESAPAIPSLAEPGLADRWLAWAGVGLTVLLVVLALVY
ncbi:MAG TPA: hypothetical protein PKE45_05275, partial [Caldilineaceae bacterium]|nr:hypothetical protein [Caldilineaceae bacterium]